VAAVQTGSTQLSVDIFNSSSPIHYPLKTDIQIKGVCVTKVTDTLLNTLIVFLHTHVNIFV